MTGQELAWLQTFTKMQMRMQKDFIGRNSEVLTPNRMRSAAERRSTKAINCGLDALGDTSNLLADAVVKGEEIKAQTGRP